MAKHYGKGPKYYLRNVALDGLSLIGGDGLLERFKQPRVHFLYFHHIFQDEKVPFKQLVAKLSKTHTFISHSEAVNRLVEGNVDKPYISWSSDDGLKSNLDAAEVLDEFGASCCFFINPSTIGLKDFDQIKDFCLEKLDMPPTEFMTWNDIEVLLKNGHEIGSHTMYHHAVVDMAIEDFKNDLKESKQIIEEKCGPIHHFAYPFGKFQYFSQAAFDAVFEMGYSSCSTAVRGSHYTNEKGIDRNQLFIRRDQIIAAWKASHIDYFISQSVKKMQPQNNLTPY